jgi:hypothetical protein
VPHFEISSIIHYSLFLYSIIFVYLFFIFLFLIIGYYVEKNSVFFVCSGEAEHKLVEVFLQDVMIALLLVQSNFFL